jgi:hypothetical protein
MAGMAAPVDGDSLIMQSRGNGLRTVLGNMGDGCWNILKINQNHRCSALSSAANYMLLGYGEWQDWDFDHEFKPGQRSGCATLGSHACGMTYYTPSGCNLHKTINK